MLSFSVIYLAYAANVRKNIIKAHKINSIQIKNPSTIRSSGFASYWPIEYKDL